VWVVFLCVWRWRSLVSDLARRELRARYAGSVLGAVWTVVEPGVQFALYFTVFSFFLGMRLESNASMGAFGLYLVSGLVPFLAFQECLIRATGLARSQALLVRHVNVPLEVLLAGALVAIVARHAISLALVVVAAAALGTIAWSLMPWFLLGMVMLLLAAWGLALVLVPAGAFLPDLAQVVATGTQVVFFLTPIVYPASSFPKAFAGWLLYNPLVGLIDAFRLPLLGSEPALARVMVAALFSVLVVVLGSAVFHRRAQAVRDLV
jgi:ABC-type polysaccharide/polyol phosphate export permease